MTPKPTPRVYRSTLRSEQAAATRQRVLAAAADCFAERGYHGTSLADIGTRAGVSAETVKGNGPKRELLLRAFEQAFAGVEGEEQIADSEAGLAFLSLDDDTYLRAVAAFIGAANARTSALWLEFLSAANTDEAIARALAGLLERRHHDYLRVTEQLISRGIAAKGSDHETAAATLSFLWSPESHQQLVVQSGWSTERYEEWLADAARRQLGEAGRP